MSSENIDYTSTSLISEEIYNLLCFIGQLRCILFDIDNFPLLIDHENIDFSNYPHYLYSDSKPPESDEKINELEILKRAEKKAQIKKISEIMHKRELKMKEEKKKIWEDLQIHFDLNFFHSYDPTKVFDHAHQIVNLISKIRKGIHPAYRSVFWYSFCALHCNLKDCSIHYENLLNFVKSLDISEKTFSNMYALLQSLNEKGKIKNFQKISLNEVRYNSPTASNLATSLEDFWKVFDDLKRTGLPHPLFRPIYAEEKTNEGDFLKENPEAHTYGLHQLCLLVILNVHHNRQNGFFQELVKIASLILIFYHNDIEKAFCILLTLIEKRIPCYFDEKEKGRNIDDKILKDLLYKNEKTRGIIEHLEKEGLDDLLGAIVIGKWFSTLYVDVMIHNVISFEILLRIWDILMIDGEEILFRVAVALLYDNRKTILEIQTQGEMMEFLQEPFDHPKTIYDPDVFIEKCFDETILERDLQISISREKYRKIELKKTRTNPACESPSQDLVLNIISDHVNVESNQYDLSKFEGFINALQKKFEDLSNLNDYYYHPKFQSLMQSLNECVNSILTKMKGNSNDRSSFLAIDTISKNFSVGVDLESKFTNFHASAIESNRIIQLKEEVKRGKICTVFSEVESGLLNQKRPILVQMENTNLQHIGTNQRTEILQINNLDQFREFLTSIKTKLDKLLEIIRNKGILREDILYISPSSNVTSSAKPPSSKTKPMEQKLEELSLFDFNTYPPNVINLYRIDYLTHSFPLFMTELLSSIICISKLHLHYDSKIIIFGTINKAGIFRTHRLYPTDIPLSLIENRRIFNRFELESDINTLSILENHTLTESIKFCISSDGELIIGYGFANFTILCCCIDPLEKIVKQRQSFGLHNGIVSCISLDEKDGRKFLATGSEDNTVILWEVIAISDGNSIMLHPKLFLPVYGINSLILKGDFCFLGDSNGNIIQYSIRYSSNGSLECSRTLVFRPHPCRMLNPSIRLVVLSPDTHWLFSYTIFNTSKWIALYSLISHSVKYASFDEYHVYNAIFNYDSRYVILGVKLDTDVYTTGPIRTIVLKVPDLVKLTTPSFVNDIYASRITAFALHEVIHPSKFSTSGKYYQGNLLIGFDDGDLSVIGFEKTMDRITKVSQHMPVIQKREDVQDKAGTRKKIFITKL